MPKICVTPGMVVGFGVGYFGVRWWQRAGRRADAIVWVMDETSRRYRALFGL